VSCLHKILCHSILCELCPFADLCYMLVCLVFLMFMAEFCHQMRTPQRANNPVGETQEKKLQDHQLLGVRADHAEHGRRVCYFFFSSCVH